LWAWRFVHTCAPNDPEEGLLDFREEPRGLKVDPGHTESFSGISPGYQYLKFTDEMSSVEYEPYKKWIWLNPGQSCEISLSSEIFQPDKKPDQFSGFALKYLND
jgi:hypothetical protein